MAGSARCSSVLCLCFCVVFCLFVVVVSFCCCFLLLLVLCFVLFICLFSKFCSRTCSHHLHSSECGHRKADIHFLIDSSVSVGQTNFDKQLDFVKKFAEEFHIGADAVRIGVTTFGSEVSHQFYMDEYMEETQLKAAIDRIDFIRGYVQIESK